MSLWNVFSHEMSNFALDSRFKIQSGLFDQQMIHQVSTIYIRKSMSFTLINQYIIVIQMISQDRL